MMPSLFIAHGAPLLAIQDNEYTRFLRQLGEQLERPKAIVLFSAHWIASTQRIGKADSYRTIYDFGGFPDELYRIQYPAFGDIHTAGEIAALLDQHGIAYDVDTDHGLDHGAWVVLHLMYPEADIPVVTMSVNPRLSPSDQYLIGQTLSALREQGILVIGSGGTVHNLGAIEFGETTKVDPRAFEFDEWLRERCQEWDLASLYQYHSLAPNGRFAVPPYGTEHFIPLFYAMGAADNHRVARLLHRSYQYGNLSQSVWQFG